MKILIYIFVAITVLPLIAGVYYITKQVEHVPDTSNVSLMVDVTEKQIAEPDASNIFSFFDFSDPENGAEFRYRNLSDKSYDGQKEAKLPPQDFSQYNEILRKREITNFSQTISKIIAGESSVSIGRKASSLYLPIARELNRLAADKSKRRVLVVYSDLFENTAEFSFYRKKDFSLLQSSPADVSNYFEGLEPLVNLSGIEIYIVYTPPDPESDKMFSEVAGFYKKFFEDKGATVNINL